MPKNFTVTHFTSLHFKIKSLYINNFHCKIDIQNLIAIARIFLFATIFTPVLGSTQSSFDEDAALESGTDKPLPTSA